MMVSQLPGAAVAIIDDGKVTKLIDSIKDDKLRAIFGKDQVSMFEMTKLVNNHVK